MTIASLKPKDKKNRKRKGRGNASGSGGECGRGHKGQKSRSGYSRQTGFEGGQTPLYRRLPKSNGFNNAMFKTQYDIINLRDLEIFSDNDIVTLDLLIQHKLVRKNKLVKLLGEGKLTKPLTLHVHKVSKAAQDSVVKLKGSIKIL